MFRSSKARNSLIRMEIAGEILLLTMEAPTALRQWPKCMARVVAIAAKGYGSALIGGIRAAKGRYVIMGDSDNS
jgi:hypothetical protein